MTEPAAAGAIHFDHIAFGLPDPAAAGALLVGVLGGRPHHAGPGAGYRFWQWEFAGGGRLEVLRPDGPADGFLQRFLARRGPGLHHVTFKVPDLPDAAARARRLGYELVGYRDANPHWKEAFLHPKQAGGITVQLAEDHSELTGGARRRLPFPGTPSAPRAAAIAGLRLSARSARPARLQWETLLSGRCEERGAELRFRWPGSAMRIDVVVDPAQPDGPLAVEVSADRPLALADGPDPVLGARFLQVAD